MVTTPAWRRVLAALVFFWVAHAAHASPCIVDGAPADCVTPAIGPWQYWGNTGGLFGTGPMSSADAAASASVAAWIANATARQCTASSASAPEPMRYFSPHTAGAWLGTVTTMCPQFTEPGTDRYGVNAVRTVEACVWPYQQYWRGGEEVFCYKAGAVSPQVSLEGRSRTRALPGGPAIVQKAKVTSNGVALSGRNVAVAITGTGVSLSGVTDAAGEFVFTYVPPSSRATVRLTASCAGCSNTAQKDITVEGAGETCPREPGTLVGNPILPGTGEKVQAEADWAGAGAHALLFVRHYRSFGVPPAGMGPGWTHNWSAAITGDDTTRSVALGSGTRVTFHRPGTAHPWQADGGAHQLRELAGGHVFVREGDESQWRFDTAGVLQSVTARNGWTMTLAYDGAQLASVTNAFGRQLRFAHDAAGRLQQVTAPDGQTLRYAYDASGRLARVTPADGLARAYLYEDARTATALTGIVDESGRRLATFTYDASGRAVGTQHAGGADAFSVNYPASSAPSGSLVSGATLNAEVYQASLAVTDALGRPRSYTYRGGDGAVRLLAASGAFDAAQVAQRTLIAGTHLPAQEVDFLGTVTMHAWDVSRHLPIATTKAAGRPEAQTTETQWHAAMRLPTLVNEAGRTTAFTYDDRGNKLTETVTDTQTGVQRLWTWTYDAAGLALSMTDPAGRIWRYGHDGAGNLTSIEDPAGRRSTFTHDAAGRVLSWRAPGRAPATYAWDVRGRLASMAQGEEVTRYTYTATGQLASVTEPSGLQMSFAYDDAQRLVTATSNRGEQVTYTLDAAGNRVRDEVRSGNGSLALAVSRVFDALDRLAAIQGAKGETTTFSYDANGVPVAEADPHNQVTRHTVDGLRRLVATTHPDDASEQFSWNALGSMTAVTDAKGVRTRYDTDAFGEVSSETSPDIGELRFTRNAAGEVTAVQDAKGQLTRIERDAVGRPSRIRYADDAEVSIGYDEAGRIRELEDASGITSLTRDAHGRVIAKSQTVRDGAGGTDSTHRLAYAHAGGKLAAVSYPSGLKVSYTREAGRITGVAVQLPRRASVPFVTGLTHTALGQPQGWTWSNGAAASRSFDENGRITATEFATYGYDAASRIVEITQRLWTRGAETRALVQTAVRWSADYDSRGRLVEFSREGARSRYTYDANSNRLTQVESTASEVDLDATFDQPQQQRELRRAMNVPDGSNRLLGFTQTVQTQQGGQLVGTTTASVNYAVDENGSMTSDGLRDFGYDASGRLVSVRVVHDGEAASIAYLHNALGQRVFKGEPQAAQTLPDQERLGRGFIAWLQQNFGWIFGKSRRARYGTVFVYGDGELPAWALLGEYGNGGARSGANTEYIWLPLEDGTAIPIGMHRGGQLYAVHTDHLGTPRLVSGKDARPVWQWPYAAHGGNRATGVLAAARSATGQITLRATDPEEPFQLGLPGQYRDKETGAQYNYFRTQFGDRYMQADPIGLNGGMNRFGYAEGAALGKKDPYGLSTYKCKKPLEALGVVGRLLFPDTPFSRSPFFHQFLCVKGPDGKSVCGGQTRAGNEVLRGTAGTPSEDHWPEAGEGECQLEDERTCVDQCVLNAMNNKTRPEYALTWKGTDCQEWATDVLQDCQKKCGGRR